MRRNVLLIGILVWCAGWVWPHSPPGESELVARIPGEPGFPEGVLIRGGLAFVSGPARDGTAGTGPSVVHVYSTGSGRLLRTYAIEGEDLSQEHAIVGMAADRVGRLYIASTQLGIVRLWPYGRGQQTQYAPPFPDLPPCHSHPAPCSPNPFDAPALPNDVAFDRDGNLYVTDTLQAVIWRVPSGGGPAEVWFSDPRLISGFGANGIRLTPDGRHLIFSVTDNGDLWRLPVVDAPTASDLEHVASLGDGGPDAIAFGRSGRIYVTLAYTHELAVLSPEGQVLERFTGPIQSPDGPIPYDNPAVFAFEPGRRSVLVVNHALFSANPDHFVLFRVAVGERGAPVYEPLIF